MTSDAELTPLSMLKRRRLDAESQGGSCEIDIGEIDALIARLSPEVRDGELLEAVAIAVFDAANTDFREHEGQLGPVPVFEWDKMAEEQREFSRHIARAAIAAWNTRAPSISRDTEVTEALTDAREAIASLDEFALGGVDIPDAHTGESIGQYGIRDELLAKIDKALAMSAEAPRPMMAERDE